MGNEGFINRPMAIALDAVRGVAAVMVLLGHAVQVGLYDGPWPFTSRIQHNPVVVFFVLSGLVIATSAFRSRGGLQDFALARVARIMPVALPALAFGTLAYLLGTALHLDVYDHAVENRTLTMQTLLFPVVFLSERGNGNGPLWNPPYWSLVYEVWYYALFGAAYYLSGLKRWLVLGALVVLAGFKVLALLPLWLLGVALARFAPAKGLPIWASIAALVAGCAVWNWCNANPYSLLRLDADWQRAWMPNVGFSEYAITHTGMGLGIMLTFLGMRPFVSLAGPLLERAAKPAGWLAGCSFTLYLMHWPLLNLMRGFGLVAGANPLLFGALICGIVVLAAQVARLTEYRRHRLRDRLKGWLTPAASRADAQGAAQSPHTS